MPAIRVDVILLAIRNHQRRATMLPKETVRRFVDEYQTGADERALEELMHPDVIDHSRPSGVAPGDEGVRQQFDALRAAFPDFHDTILDQIADGDKDVTRKAFTATHLGSSQGIEPTMRQVEINLIDIVRVADGKIVEHWNCVDRLGLLAQLGALPEAAVK